jgi:hypothetical protein
VLLVYHDGLMPHEEPHVLHPQHTRLSDRARSHAREVRSRQNEENKPLKLIAVLDYTVPLSILQPHSFDERDQPGSRFEKLNELHHQGEKNDMAAEMGDLEQKIRLGIGSAAAAAAIFAPINYRAKSILTGIAASMILSAVYRKVPITRLLGI